METESVRYIGPLDEVELVVPPTAENPSSYARSRVVAQGEVAEDVPMSVAENLVDQGTWEYVGEGPAGTPDPTPGAVELAAEHGLNLDDITGTGTGDRVTKGDVQKAIDAAPPVDTPTDPVVVDPVAEAGAGVDSSDGEGNPESVED